MPATTTTGSLIILCIAAMLWHLPCHAEVYKWVDSHGVVHFSDKGAATEQARPVERHPPLNTYTGRVPADSTAVTRPGETRVKSPPQTSSPTLAPRQVVMYSAPWCGYCKQAKAYFQERGIAFTERDIEQSATAKREYQALGGEGIPLILVGHKEGTRKFSGFSIARLDEALR